MRKTVGQLSSRHHLAIPSVWQLLLNTTWVRFLQGQRVAQSARLTAKVEIHCRALCIRCFTSDVYNLPGIFLFWHLFIWHLFILLRHFVFREVVFRHADIELLDFTLGLFLWMLTQGGARIGSLVLGYAMSPLWGWCGAEWSGGREWGR
ncbi:MAG: hypothetical protein J0L73_24155 [Verrucomicrobia bacterium]|nr:hypothetical protein [Verrucomicrobiota bacterium]